MAPKNQNVVALRKVVVAAQKGIAVATPVDVDVQAYKTARSALLAALEALWQDAKDVYDADKTVPNLEAVYTTLQALDKAKIDFPDYDVIYKPVADDADITMQSTGGQSVTMNASQWAQFTSFMSSTRVRGTAASGTFGMSGHVDLKALGLAQLPRFDGDQSKLSAKRFLTRLEDMRDSQNWDSHNSAFVLGLCFPEESEPRRWLDNLRLKGSTAVTDYDELKPLFEARFPANISYAQKALVRAGLVYNHQEHRDCISFWDSCQAASFILYPREEVGEATATITISELRVRTSLLNFVCGMPSDCREQVAKDGANTEAEVIASVRKAMAAKKAKFPPTQADIRQVKGLNVLAVEDQEEHEQTVSAVGGRKKVSPRGQQNDKAAREKIRLYRRDNGLCFYCGKNSHMKSDCEDYKKSPNYRPTPYRSGAASGFRGIPPGNRNNSSTGGWKPQPGTPRYQGAAPAGARPGPGAYNNSAVEGTTEPGWEREWNDTVAPETSPAPATAAIQASAPTKDIYQLFGAEYGC